MQQQQRSQRKGASHVAQDEMSFLVHAILRRRLSAQGNACLTNHWRDAVRDWPNFHAPSMSIVNLDEVNLLHSGHRPKLFLFLLEEMAYAYAHVNTDDIDGLWVMVYEVLTMAEMRYHLRKRSANPLDMMWGYAMSCIVLGDLTGLEKLVWAVFDGALAAGPSPELGPDESWEQVVCGIFDKLVYVRRNPLTGALQLLRCKGHAGTWSVGRGTRDMQPPPGLRAHPEYQQGVPGILCKINGFGGTPGASGVPKEAGH